VGIFECKLLHIFFTEIISSILAEFSYFNGRGLSTSNESSVSDLQAEREI
jgi:hypothetical protein